jgi:DNA polymerase III epsilon subunit-like protein
LKVFLFDTETTGLVKNSLIPLNHQPRIIEFYGHTIDDETGETLEEIEFFCNPGVGLDNVITRITGIKPEDLKHAKPFSEYAPQISAAIGRVDAVVAHNLSFDMVLVESDCARCQCDIKFPQRLICTVEQTEWIKGHRLSLTALHEELFGEPFKDAHRARSDVEALTRCYLELRKRGDL